MAKRNQGLIASMTREQTASQPKAMSAKFAGRCHDCGGDITVGDSILYEPLYRRASHYTCPTPETTVQAPIQTTVQTSHECFQCGGRYSNVKAVMEHKQAAHPKTERKDNRQYSSQPCDDCGDASFQNIVTRRGKVICNDCLEG